MELSDAFTALSFTEEPAPVSTGLTTAATVVPSLHLEDLFLLRKQIYDNKELFHEIAKSNLDSNVGLESSTECELEEYVVEARKRLNGFMHTYNIIRTNIEDLEKQRQDIMEASHAIKHHSHKLEHLLNLTPGEHAGNALDTMVEARCKQLDATMQEKKKELSDVSKELKRLSRVFRILKNTTLFYTCPICLVHDVSCFVIPCGHTLCDGCSMHIPGGKCFMCRSPIERVQQLYFS